MGSRKAHGETLVVPDPVEIESDDPPPLTLQGEPVEFWFEVTISDRRIVHGFVSEAALTKENDGDPCFALTMIERGLIVFDRELKRDRRRLANVLFHETGVHAGLHAPISSPAVVRRLLGARTDQIANDREEGIAAYISNNVAVALYEKGIFRLPRVPR